MPPALQRDTQPSQAGAHTAAAPAMAEPLGAASRYRIEKLLGKGGFGEAYLARDTHLDRLCVVKRLVIDDTWTDAEARVVRQNFEREARLLVTLNEPGHPNIPEIYEYLPSSQALVMKYIAGHSLGRLLDQRADPLSESEALQYIRQVAAALVYLHQRRPDPVLHRDIKPTNILLGDDGRIWLIDFGLAKALPAALPLTDQVTQLAGSLGYSPPEQWRGAAEPRSDVYALAATLYMLLTNYQPSRSQLLALMRGQAAALPPLRQINPAARPQIEQLIERAMDADVEQRPTAQAFLEAIEALQRPPAPAPPEPSAPPVVPEFVGRDQEIAQYRRQLEAEDLAVITGLPGVGKTALAATLARQSAAPERIFWHAFHRDEGVDSLLWDLAGFLAARGQAELWELLHGARIAGGPPPPPNVLSDYALARLRGQDYLICLDDVHMVEDGSALEQLVGRLADHARARQLRVLLTSRTLPPFVAAAPAALPGLSAGAARVLAQRYGLALPDSLLADVVQHTGGNPQLLLLAIDALRRAAEPEQLVGRLAEVADIERYLLREVDAGLSADERGLMGALAALLGYPATLDAIEAVFDGAGSLRRLLSRLATRNLLIVAENERGRTYVQHAIIQSFYYEALSKRERLIIHRSAGAYYEHEAPDALKAARHYQLAGDWARAAALASADIWPIVNAGQGRPLRLLLGQFSSRQVAAERWIDLLIARGDLDTLFEQAAAARDSYQAALEQLEAQPDTPDTRRRVARACYGIGAALEYAKPQEALPWLQRGLALLAEHDQDPAEQANLLLRIGSTQIAVGEFGAARAALDHSLRLLPVAADEPRADVLTNLGVVDWSQGLPQAGVERFNQALQIYQHNGNRWKATTILQNLAILLDIDGDWIGAAEKYHEALDLAIHLGNVRRQAAIELPLGILHTKRGERELAAAHLDRCIALARAYAIDEYLIAGLASLADLHIHNADWQRAAAVLAEAQPLAEQFDAKDQLAELARGWAQLDLARGDLPGALAHAERAVVLARELELDREEGIAQRVRAEALHATGRSDEAEQAFSHSLALLDNRDLYEAARTRLAWGQVLISAGDAQRGEELVQVGTAVFAALAVQ